MAKLNWNPWMCLDELGEELDRRFSEEVMQADAARYWTPPADMVENDRHVHIVMDVPGLRLEDLAVELCGDELVICGRRPFKRDTGKSVYHALERNYGPFLRRFILPASIDRRSVAARILDGVLTISIAKRAKGKRSIKVG